MNWQNITMWVLVVALFGLLVTVIVLSIPAAKREHEFINDLTSIKLNDGNELTDALCQVKYCKTTKNTTDSQCKYVTSTGKDYPDLFDAIKLMTGSGEEVQTDQDKGKSFCRKLDSKTLNNLKTGYSFTKLQAEQIYMNNQGYINYVYGNSEGRNCMKNFFSMLNLLLKGYKRGQFPMDKEMKDAVAFINCYNNLNSINKKYIDIILSQLVIPELSNVLSNFNLDPHILCKTPLASKITGLCDGA